MWYMLLFSVAVIYWINKISSSALLKRRTKHTSREKYADPIPSNSKFKFLESRSTRSLYGNLILRSHLKKKKKLCQILDSKLWEQF